MMCGLTDRLEIIRFFLDRGAKHTVFKMGEQGSSIAYLENGRIKDDETIRLKSALREICDTFNPGVRLTAHQSILFTDLDPAAKGDVERLLRLDDHDPRRRSFDRGQKDRSRPRQFVGSLSLLLQLFDQFLPAFAVILVHGAISAGGGRDRFLGQDGN